MIQTQSKILIGMNNRAKVALGKVGKVVNFILKSVPRRVFSTVGKVCFSFINLPSKNSLSKAVLVVNVLTVPSVHCIYRWHAFVARLWKTCGKLFKDIKEIKGGR